MAAKNPLQINQIKQNISSLEGEMKGLNEQLDMNPSDFFPSDDILPGLNDIEIFNYQAEIDSIQSDCEETLQCLSSLYLNVAELEKKNISNIIKNDALALADLKFSLSCSKRGLINLMRQLDMGINDPLMYQAVSNFQKEIRDSVKMSYDIQKKMKDFYKDIRDEISSTTINSGEEEEIIQEIKPDDETYQIVDWNKINDDIDSYMKNVKEEKNK